MIGGEILQVVGTAVAFAGAVWLWGLRRRGILGWKHGRVPIAMFIIGIWMDLLPLVVEAVTRGVGAALDLFNAIGILLCYLPPGA